MLPQRDGNVSGLAGFFATFAPTAGASSSKNEAIDRFGGEGLPSEMLPPEFNTDGDPAMTMGGETARGGGEVDRARSIRQLCSTLGETGGENEPAGTGQFDVRGGDSGRAGFRALVSAKAELHGTSSASLRPPLASRRCHDTRRAVPAPPI